MLHVLARPGAFRELAVAQCAQAQALAVDLGLHDDVVVAMAQIYERYDGRGEPHALRGEEVGLAAALTHAAHTIEVVHRRAGRTTVLDELARRRGGQLAPAVCDVARAEADALWTALEAPAALELVLGAEPEPWSVVDAPELDRVALAFARFADLKTPHTLGHSTNVAEAVAAAATREGWPADEVRRVRLAALLHDLGSVSVSNRVWERAGPLGAAGWEQVRLHAYWTERILQRTPATATLASIAGATQERLDATGYHRGLRSDGLDRAARLLAAADAFVAMGEERPYRAAHAPDERARILSGEARAGRLCRNAVSMILAGDGTRSLARSGGAAPAGLTAREIDVLSLLARGRSNKEIAATLGIAVRTVKHHIEHVYEKTGISSRAAAALFAVRYDLV